MAIPLTAVSICNLSLDLLQTAAISSIDPGTTREEKICARWFDTTRRALLESHPWNFAIKRLQLPVDSEDPPFGFSARYQVPNDMLRLLRVGERGQIKLYELEGEFIFTSITTTGITEGPLAIKYIKDFVDFGQMSQLFVYTFAIKLALNLARPITGKTSLVQNLNALLAENLQEARSIDGQESPPKRVERSRFLRQRRAFGLGRTASDTLIFDD